MSEPKPLGAGETVKVEGHGTGTITQTFANGAVVEVEIPATESKDKYYVTASKDIVTRGQ